MFVEKTLAGLLVASSLACSSESSSGSVEAGTSGAGACEVQDGVCVPTNESLTCSTLKGHRLELDVDAGCKKLLDPEWSVVLCVPQQQPVAVGATATCYRLEDEGGVSTFLGNNYVSGPIVQAGLAFCTDITAAELLSTPDCL